MNYVSIRPVYFIYRIFSKVQKLSNYHNSAYTTLANEDVYATNVYDTHLYTYMYTMTYLPTCKYVEYIIYS